MNDTQQQSGQGRLGIHSDCLVVGVVRDCARNLEADVLRLKAALAKAKNVYWLLVESDSADKTVSSLEKIAQQIDNFRFISLGTLRSRLPLRTERIAHCRNTYLDELSSNPLYLGVEHVIVSDFDGLNTRITEDAILSCWERAGWDACAANQAGPYYDVWALRHKKWCANDCWAQFRFLNQFSRNVGQLSYACVYSKMIKIPPDNDWIEVDSAFGGLVIYRREILKDARYIGLSDQGEEICEHVLFHQQLRQQGRRIFINPRMINAGYTAETRQLMIRNRLVRLVKGSLRRGAESLIGEHNVARIVDFVARDRS